MKLRLILAGTMLACAAPAFAATAEALPAQIDAAAPIAPPAVPRALDDAQRTIDLL